MAEEGVNDFHTAKRKAANRLNLPEAKHLPSNQEVESALQQYLQLFHAERLAHDVRRLRALAAEAMRFFARFEPRLVGPVLAGTVTPSSEIQLHLAAETPEDVALMLQEHHIPFDQTERRTRFGGERYEMLPVYRFQAVIEGAHLASVSMHQAAGPGAPAAGNATIELCVFDSRSMREPPLSPVDGRPMKRANLKELEELLEGSSVRC